MTRDAADRPTAPAPVPAPVPAPAAVDDGDPSGGDSHPAVRIGILDDHAVIVDGIAFWIAENAPDVQVDLRATSWMDLIRDPAFPVDLVLMDLQLPEPVSIESRIRACRAAGAEVVVVTALDDEESRARCLAAGAAAFVPKTLPVADIVDVARRVARGERVRDGAAPVAAAAASVGGTRAEVAEPGLSAAERRAVALYVQGLSTAEVANRMDVGYETAKTYLRRARDKYARAGRPAGRRSELIRRAAEDGMLE